MNNYSDNLLRGIPSSNWVTDGLVTSAAFQFDDQPAHIKNGWMLQSIYWEDDGSVVGCMFQQKKDDSDQFQFKVGIARVLRESINYLNRLMSLRGIISYEREPLENNPYHGNLLVSKSSSKTQRKLVAANIASHVLDFIPRP